MCGMCVCVSACTCMCRYACVGVHARKCDSVICPARVCVCVCVCVCLLFVICDLHRVHGKLCRRPSS